MAASFKRAAVGATATVIASVLLSPSSAHAQHRAAPVQPSLTNLRLCEARFFDRQQNRCLKDQRGMALLANAFFCSVTVRASPGTTLRRAMAYRGQLVHTDEA